MAMICAKCGGIMPDVDFDDSVKGPWDCSNHIKQEVDVHGG